MIWILMTRELKSTIHSCVMLMQEMNYIILAITGEGGYMSLL